MDTIYALSSGGLPSGVAIVRLSGPSAWAVASLLVVGLPSPGRLQLTKLTDPFDGSVLDEGMIACFKAPHSFTGEDVVELHCHGSRATVAAVFRVLSCQDNCRIAEAGEFSRRGFENGKFDLTEIEGLSDLIGAETEAQRVLALRQASGEMRSLFDAWRADLIRCRALIEAELDFSDEEDVPGGVSLQVWNDVKKLEQAIAGHLEIGRSGEVIREGFHVVLAGPPNAGKSSLLNALARRDVAIVTSEAGTTRDIIDVSIDLDGFKIIVSDTAGIRNSDNLVEKEGIRRANELMQIADEVLWLQAPGDKDSIDRPSNSTLIFSKSDLAASETDGTGLWINTIEPSGLDDLLVHLQSLLATHVNNAESAVVTRQRHRELLIKTALHLTDSLGDDVDIEIRSEHLRRAADHLGRLTGRIDVEDLLDVIFSEFCIGK